MAVVTMKSLLEAGVHFGHQTKRWDPRMKKFIFAERNGIHIIDLQKTMACIKEAYEAVRQTVLAKKSVLFIGTKKQAQQAIQSEAEKSGMFFVNQRWPGGMLTNFTTIKKSILRLKKLEKMEVDGTFESLTKREVALLMKERTRLEKVYGGIKEMKELPGIIFIIDTRKEAIATAEANRMGIPVCAVVDTNCNPEGIQYPIPGNDDAIRAISLFTSIISKAVIEADNEIGLEIIETMQDDDEDYAAGGRPINREEEGTEEDFEDESAEKETVTLAAQAGVEEEKVEQESFAAEDYSDYTPEEVQEKVIEKTVEEKVAEEAGITEEELYDGE